MRALSRIPLGRAMSGRGRPWVTAGVATAAVAAYIAGAHVFGELHSAFVVESSVRDHFADDEHANVVMDLAFSPEQFNLLALQEHGVLARFDERHVFLTGVTREGVQAIGSNYWVQRVSLWEP